MPIFVLISEQERRHFEAIREAKELERAERLREALDKHAVERMREGLDLGAGYEDDQLEAALELRALAQAEFARRGRALGLRVEDGKPTRAS